MRSTMRTTTLLLALASLATCNEVLFKEEFADASWEEKWIQSKHKDDYGEFKLSAGKFYGDAKRDQGLQTTQDSHFYARAAKFPKSFSNKDKSLVIQFTVKHEQGIDCGGGYIKLFKSDVDLADMHGETPYEVMFGPDICGFRKVHVILNYKGKNHELKKYIHAKDDDLTHLYTLILNPDNTYEVQIDGEKVEAGEMENDWDLLPPKLIEDPKVTKPEDWDDRKRIADPEEKKPEDWDSEPEHIPDMEAKKPEEWNDETDGEWERPMIDNPAYKGEWKAKQIDNPNYKGKWIHPMIENPDYSPDSDLYLHEDLAAIGFDLWQVKAGTIFDNILVADSVEEAKAHAAETFEKLRTAEKEKKAEEEKRKKTEEEESKKIDEKNDEEDGAVNHEEL